jgi:protein-L-isoaspartate(D-aspartate) O-methyltransferase
MMNDLRGKTKIPLGELYDTQETKQLRERMVRLQLAENGIVDPRVLAAIENVPRHWFCPPGTAPENAYGNYPLPFGWGATISQPWMVADMLQVLKLTGEETILEVGTGSGYNAALLGRLACRVVSLEIVPELAARAQQLLHRGGFHTVEVHLADGSLGWPLEAPYDAIIVTAGAPGIPEALTEQLRVGGRLVIPVGDRTLQHLQIVEKTGTGFTLIAHSACRFVPLHGKEGWQYP